ncbi:MAG: hypothetical protein QXF56_02705 [Candidatus Micrarchaeia archaeon]
MEYEWVDLYKSSKAPKAFYEAYQKKLDIVDEKYLVKFIKGYRPENKKNYC